MADLRKFCIAVHLSKLLIIDSLVDDLLGERKSPRLQPSSSSTRSQPGSEKPGDHARDQQPPHWREVEQASTPSRHHYRCHYHYHHHRH